MRSERQQLSQPLSPLRAWPVPRAESSSLSGSTRSGVAGGAAGGLTCGAASWSARQEPRVLRYRIAQEGDDLLAHAGEPAAQPKRRADGIRIRVDVAHHPDAVGGSQQIQQTYIATHGNPSEHDVILLDGMLVNTTQGDGQIQTYIENEMIQEFVYNTTNNPVESIAGGVYANLVPKDGGNALHGEFFGAYVPSQFVGTNLDATLVARGAPQQSAITNLEDFDGSLGGPFIKDKLWFWGAFGKQDVNILTTSVLTSGARFQDRTELKNENIKLNAQPIASNSLTFVDQYGAKIKMGRNVSAARFPETGWNQNDTYAHGTGSLSDPTLWKIEDTQILGTNLYLTAAAARDARMARPHPGRDGVRLGRLARRGRAHALQRAADGRHGAAQRRAAPRGADRCGAHRRHQRRRRSGHDPQAEAE